MTIEVIDGIKLDIKPNEIRYRVVDPSKFDSSSFRRKKIIRGISLLIGCPKGNFVRKKCKVGTQMQALRFNRDDFTPSKAAAWVRKHEGKLRRKR